ncbi:MAG: PilZ domain-containing protein [Polyangiaceae bacterium]
MSFAMAHGLSQSGGSTGGSTFGPRKFRVHDRKTVRLQVSVTHIASGWVRAARVQNLGFGGACLELDEDVGAGDRLLLSFVAPALWDPLTIRSRVAWSRPRTERELTRCGASFEHGNPADVFALFELVGSLVF